MMSPNQFSNSIIKSKIRTEHGMALIAERNIKFDNKGTLLQ